jgi:very-short-patch-repair endonuclease
LLWTHPRLLRGVGLSFRCQHPVGPYIADFYCAAAKLVVEVDGAHHAEDDRIAHDEARSAYLQRLGYRVVRCPARDVIMNVDDAAQRIVQAALYWKGR